MQNDKKTLLFSRNSRLCNLTLSGGIAIQTNSPPFSVNRLFSSNQREQVDISNNNVRGTVLARKTMAELNVAQE